jgi:hypothetical protein
VKLVSTQHRDKNLRWAKLVSEPVDDHLHRLAGVIDKRLLPPAWLRRIVTESREAQPWNTEAYLALGACPFRKLNRFRLHRHLESSDGPVQ